MLLMHSLGLAGAAQVVVRAGNAAVAEALDDTTAAIAGHAKMDVSYLVPWTSAGARLWAAAALRHVDSYQLGILVAQAVCYGLHQFVVGGDDNGITLGVLP